MFARRARSLPVLIYHSVSNFRGGLTLSPEAFEQHCRTLAENGWQGVGLDQAEDFLVSGAPLPVKSCLITLDDGYLDNYVNVWPILAKYGHKGVIFPVAEAVSAAGSNSPRPTLADVWSGKCGPCDLPDLDHPMRDSGLGYLVRQDIFFTWEEARIMEASGVMALGGHSLRHESVFTGPEYQGFFQPGQVETSFNHTVENAFWGMPRFKRGAQLTSRAFWPDEELLAALREAVPQDEPSACEFFRHAGNIERLQRIMRSFEGRLGRMENEEEQHERIFGIMRENQAILQKELGHAARSFCWPWGHKNELSLKAGRAAGFEVFFNVRPGPNPPGRPLAVNRFNAKADPRKTLSRTRVYSRPWLGELYRMIR